MYLTSSLFFFLGRSQLRNRHLGPDAAAASTNAPQRARIVHLKREPNPPHPRARAPPRTCALSPGLGLGRTRTHTHTQRTRPAPPSRRRTATHARPPHATRGMHSASNAHATHALERARTHTHLTSHISHSTRLRPPPWTSACVFMATFVTSVTSDVWTRILMQHQRTNTDNPLVQRPKRTQCVRTRARTQSHTQACKLPTSAFVATFATPVTSNVSQKHVIAIPKG